MPLPGVTPAPRPCGADHVLHHDSGNASAAKEKSSESRRQEIEQNVIWFENEVGRK